MLLEPIVSCSVLFVHCFYFLVSFFSKINMYVCMYVVYEIQCDTARCI